MKAARLHAIGDFRVDTVPVPTPNGAELLVRIGACGVCGSDIPRIYVSGTSKQKYPLTIGHEFSGTVVAVGPDADPTLVGKRGAFFPLIPCRRCDSCLSGNYAMCEDYDYMGSRRDGGFAEYVIIPEKAVRQGNLVKINTGGTMSYAKAAVVEPLSCVYNGFEKLNIRPNDTVLIIGSGPIGIMHAILAKMGGASKVIVNDLNENRLATVSEFDPFFKTYHGDCLKEYIMAETEGRGVDACITACPAPAAQAMALELLAMNGRVNFFGGLPAGRDRVELSTNLIHYKQLVVTGSARASLRQYRTCMRLVESGIIGIDGILSAEYPLEDYEKAITAARRGEKLKHIFVF